MRKITDNLKDRRVRSRRGVSISERISCKLKNETFEIQGGMISLSPGGAAIACVIPEGINIHLGQKFTAEFEISGLETVRLQVTVANFSPFNTERQNYQRVGLQFSLLKDNVDADRRSSGRFEISEFMRPIISFENPIFEYCMIHARIVNISANSIKCETSSRNNSIIPGMTFRFNVTFPIVGDLQFKGKVLYYLPDSADDRKVIFGVQIQSKLSDFQRLASELLVMVNPNVNTKLLSENGFAIGSILAGVSLGYAFDEAEIQQISILRSKAWQQIGFFKDVKNPKEMFDEFDRYSRHMIARVNGKIVASARLVFNNGHIDRCEHHKYQVTIPAWLWQEGFVETSRLVTDPDYRGGDLFLLMTQMIGKTVIQSGYRYMVSSCTQSLEKIYISSGCKKIGSFYTEDCKEPWTLLVMDVVSTSKGFGMNPIFWNLVQRPMVEYLEKRRYFALNWLEKCFMSFYKLFGPFADLVIQFKLNRKSEKKEQSEKAA